MLTNLSTIQRSPLFLPLLFFIAGIGIGNLYFLALVFAVLLIEVVCWHYNNISLELKIIPSRFKFHIILSLFFLLGFAVQLFDKNQQVLIPDKVKLVEGELSFYNGVRFSKRGAWTLAEIHINQKELSVLVNMDSSIASSVEKGDSMFVNDLVLYPLLKKGKQANGWEEYLMRQGVYCKTYLNKNQKSDIHKNKQWFYFTYNFLHQKILQSQLNENSKSLLLSLLIGDRGYLDKETKDKFSLVGVSHILSVSGLHVGIIYLILTFLIGLVWSKNSYSSLLIILSLIWFYCWMVGFEAAVLRSALMFTLHVVGNAFGRKSSLLHSTCVSAFLILMYNHRFLYDIGFQLTYGAMLGIVFLMPLLQEKVKLKQSYLKPVLDLLLLSLAVQISLVPLLIHHFQNKSCSTN